MAARSPLISCAECRRTKARCSKDVPCSSCRAKGIPQLCPNGISPSRSDPAYLTQADALEKRKQDLVNYVHRLEQALSESHRVLSPQSVHPLLTPQHLAVAGGPAPAPATTSFGEMQTSTTGRSRWLGPSALATWLMEEGDASKSRPSALSPVMAATTSLSPADMRVRLLKSLPPKNVCDQYTNRYFSTIGVTDFLLSRADLEEEIIRPMRQNTGGSGPAISNHQLAFFYMILAVGAAFDPPKSDTFVSLAQLALAQDSIFTHASLATLQTILLMLIFFNNGRQGNKVPDESWGLCGLAISVAHTIGLHVEPVGVDPKEGLKRRRVWWELYCQDKLISALTGRPYQLNHRHSTTQMPFDSEETIGLSYLFARWKHQFTEGCVVPLLEHITDAQNPTSYTTVLRLTKKLKAFAIPAQLSQMAVEAQAHGDIALFAQVCIAETQKDFCVFLLHREYFVSAIKEGHDDPLKSQYAESIVNVFDMSKSMIARFRRINDTVPYALNFQPLWPSFLLDNLVALAGLVSSKPLNQIANEALAYFENGIQLMEDTAAKQGAGLISLVPNHKLSPFLAKLRIYVHGSVAQSRRNQGGNTRTPPRTQGPITALWRFPTAQAEEASGPNGPPSAAESQSSGSEEWQTFFDEFHDTFQRS